MTLPNSAELTRIRADMQAATLPDTCNILSVTRVSDGMGGHTETWGTATASVACRLDLSVSRIGVVGEEQVSSAVLKPFSTWILSVPYGTSISNANRVEFGSETYNVSEVDAGRSWGGNVRATLERL